MGCNCDPLHPKVREVTPALEKNRFLTEGCCINRCGPLVRTGDQTATCSCCGLKWTSGRIPSIWPSGSFK